MRARIGALGVSLGTGLWVVLVAVGLSRLVNAFERGPDVLRAGSAALLAYFFVKNLRSAGSSSGPSARSNFALEGGVFWKGFLVNVLNPNSAAFFLSLFAPLLVQTNDPLELAVCIAGVIVLSVAWYQTLVSLASQPTLQQVLARSERLMRWVFAGVYLYFLVRVLRSW